MYIANAVLWIASTSHRDRRLLINTPPLPALLPSPPPLPSLPSPPNPSPSLHPRSTLAHLTYSGGYIADKWNRFDFFLVSLAIADELTTNIGRVIPGLQPTLLRVLRVLRAARVLRAFRIVRISRGLRSLLKTVVLSLPALGNILGLYVIMLFTFSVLAMELFSKVHIIDTVSRC